MNLKVWTPRDGETANFQPTLVRIYFADDREAYVQRRWIGRRPSGSYETHRACKGEAIGHFAFDFSRLPAGLRDLALDFRAARLAADGFTPVAADPDDEALFDALWELAADPVFLAAAKEKRKSIKAFRDLVSPFRAQLAACAF